MKPPFSGIAMPSVSDLAETLRSVWKRVRSKHLFPELPHPRIIPTGSQAILDLFGKNISIPEALVRDRSSRIAPERIIEALLDHGVSHHLYCPWSFFTYLSLYAEAKSVLSDPSLARRAADAFMDVTADTYCFSRVATPLPELYRHNKQASCVETVLQALRQELWQTDLGVASHKETAGRLATIAYLDPSRWRTEIRRFTDILTPYLRSDADRTDSDRLPVTGAHGLHQYDRSDIEHGLREMAAQVNTPAAFSAILDDFAEEIIRVLGAAENGIGRGIATAELANVLFYMKRAEALRLPIRGLPMKKSGALYPHHHLPWEVGTPLQDIDPWSSFGMTMPGITKSWKRLQGTVFDRRENTPDCMVLIDSSSSMTHPRHHLSHAVLGAACAADAYLRNGARVAVGNFSDTAKGGERLMGYTGDRAAVYRALCTYLGGGTYLDPHLIDALQRHPPPDIFLITDLQITNLETVTEYLERCTNRITAVHIGESFHADRFRRRVDPRANVAIFPVTTTADIPRIIIGKVKDYLYPRSHGTLPRSLRYRYRDTSASSRRDGAFDRAQKAVSR